MDFILQVVASSTSDTTFSGSFELQLLSMEFQCTFSFTKGVGAKFDPTPSIDGKFILKCDGPSVSGSTATLEGNIIV